MAKPVANEEQYVEQMNLLLAQQTEWFKPDMRVVLVPTQGKRGYDGAGGLELEPDRLGWLAAKIDEQFDLVVTGH